MKEFAVGLIVFAALSADAQQVVELPRCPVKIVNYSARYSPGPPLERDVQGIHHDVEYTATEEPVDAVRFGFVVVDQFDEVRAVVYSNEVRRLDPGGKPWNHTLIHQTAHQSAFRLGLMFVYQVRLSSGFVWLTDPAPVIEAIQRIDPTIDSIGRP